MHDPDFLAFELHAPIPVRDRWRSRMAREGKRLPMVSRRTNEANLGERTYPWWQLKGYMPRVGNHVFRFPPLIEGWHHEPGDADSGTVCKDRPYGTPRWLWRHRKHMSYRLVPYRTLRHMLERCADCKRRFWRRARFGTGWDSPTTICNECSRIRTLRHQVADLAKYVRLECTQTEAWRVERAWIGDEATAVQYFTDVGVGRSLPTGTPEAQS